MRRSYTSGYTLVEVSIALIVLGVGMASLLAIFPAALKSAEDTRNMSTVPYYVRNIIADLDNYTSSSTFCDGFGYFFDVRVSAGSGLRDVEIDCYPSSKYRDDHVETHRIATYRLKHLK